MDQPTRLGRYALVRRVGAGGFATVWLAYDEELDADVAVKILSDNWQDEQDVRRRFIAEGRFLRRVDSPHVVNVHDIGETEDGRPYLVLTYADRGSLAERIKAGPLPVDAAVEVIGQVGEGLRELHQRGVLHRDVKPANVLFRSITGGERAMLGDLGLGKALDNASQLTMPGGTPAYAAPEQVMGERIDQRADQYSLGAVAYAALTGSAPHGVNSLGAVMRIDAPPPAMSTLRAAVPPAVDAVVRRALEPDRDRRWPTIDAFLDALRAAHDTGTVPKPLPVAAAPPPPPAVDPAAPTELTPAPRFSRRAWLVAILVAALLGGAGGYGGYRVIFERPAEVSDLTNTITVRAPREWNQAASGWTPVPGKDQQPGLLVTPSLDGWHRLDYPPPGVFAGVLLGNKLSVPMPARPGCGKVEPARSTPVDGRPALTRLHPGCPGGTVYERLIQIDSRRQLLIQVRSTDPIQAREVLDSIRF